VLRWLTSLCLLEKVIKETAGKTPGPPKKKQFRAAVGLSHALRDYARISQQDVF